VGAGDNTQRKEAMTYIFKPPTVNESPAGFSRLFWRYKIARGDSILVYGTAIVRERTPGVDETQAADYCYLGGHEYVITQTEVDILTNGGYGYCITTTA
jgi:hypothetical protein